MDESLKESAEIIKTHWLKFRSNCGYYNPYYYPGYDYLTEHYCNRRDNKGAAALSLGACSISRCPIIWKKWK